MEGKSQEAAAAASGMSVRSARKWQRNGLPSTTKRDRSWRTRADPFAEIWERDVVPLLESDHDSALQATTIFEVLEERYPGRFRAGQVRTLQRRLRDWRALHGGEREVFFPQDHPPGREAQMDFTHATGLRITIAGRVLDHLLFELVLSYSGWRWVCIAYGETFEALVAGLQGALWALGGVPQVGRTDNLSAATHELKQSGGRALTKRFKAVLDHYGMESTRIRPYKSNENGVVEHAHHRLKTALDQALILRSSREFASIAEYEAFLARVVDKLNRRASSKIDAERAALAPLPAAPVPAYSTCHPKVRRWSTVRVVGRTYSVPSRLIGHEVEVRVHPDVVEVYYRNQHIETMDRLRGDKTCRIDYRHVIWSLVRKPGAFARYRFREELFPTLIFRRAYDALLRHRGERADVEYVRILHLAASTMECTVERALGVLLETGQAFEYAMVKQLADPDKPAVPQLSVPSEPDLKVYDALLTGGAR